MAKDRNLVEKRINAKIKLLRTYPEAVLYQFKNPLIRESFLRNIRQIDAGFDAIIDNWGYSISTDIKNEVERDVESVKEEARNIINYIMSNSSGKFSYTDLMRKSLSEKEEEILNSPNVMELLIPIDKSNRVLFEAVTYIDYYDDEIKRKGDAEEWIEKVSNFKDIVQRVRDKVVNTIVDNIDPKYLSKHRNLQKVVQRIKQSKAKEQ